jgi:hypothetical protein
MSRDSMRLNCQHQLDSTHYLINLYLFLVLDQIRFSLKSKIKLVHSSRGQCPLICAQGQVQRMTGHIENTPCDDRSIANIWTVHYNKLRLIRRRLQEKIFVWLTLAYLKFRQPGFENLQVTRGTRLHSAMTETRNFWQISSFSVN